MVLVETPQVLRAMFGTLNTPLMYSCGAIYPISTMNPALRHIAALNPSTYSCDALKSLLIKNAGFEAIWGDLASLSIFSLAMLLPGIKLFERNL